MLDWGNHTQRKRKEKKKFTTDGTDGTDGRGRILTKKVFCRFE
jgi:hypothetical protein